MLCVADQLTAGFPRPCDSMVATPKSPEKPEQLSGLTKPASRKDGHDDRLAPEVLIHHVYLKA